MKALVIYDSFFGNTEKVAQAIVEALGADAQIVKVTDVQPGQLAGLDLLVVGSPTRGFRASPATMALLNGLPANALQGVKVAAFDTRIIPQDIKAPVARAFLTFMISIFGYAAKPILNALTKKGGQQVAEPEGFIVLDSEGPLREGELARAGDWARSLAAS
jgi:flavodoxin I